MIPGGRNGRAAPGPHPDRMAVCPPVPDMDDKKPIYPREGGFSLIEIRLASIGQLFDPLDPAPIAERSLDWKSEEYIVGSARDLPAGEPLKLVLYLPPADLASPDAAQIASAIRNYFDYRVTMAARNLRHLWREGRLTLAIGFGSLFICIGLRQLIFAFAPGPLLYIVAESLLILGWVAMWRPVQLFLYEWWPLRRDRATFAKLRDMPVELRPAPAPAALPQLK